MWLILLSLLILFGHHPSCGIWGLDVLGIKKVNHVEHRMTPITPISISSTDRVGFRILFISFYHFLSNSTKIHSTHCLLWPSQTHTSQPHEHLAHLHCKLRFLVVPWLSIIGSEASKDSSWCKVEFTLTSLTSLHRLTCPSELRGFRVQVLKIASKKINKLPFQQNALAEMESDKTDCLSFGRLCFEYQNILIIQFWPPNNMDISGWLPWLPSQTPCTQTALYKCLPSPSDCRYGASAWPGSSCWSTTVGARWSNTLVFGRRSTRLEGQTWTRTECEMLGISWIVPLHQSADCNCKVWRFTLCGWYTRLGVAHSMPMIYWTNFDCFSWLTKSIAVSVAQTHRVWCLGLWNEASVICVYVQERQAQPAGNRVMLGQDQGLSLLWDPDLSNKHQFSIEY